MGKFVEGGETEDCLPVKKKLKIMLLPVNNEDFRIRECMIRNYKNVSPVMLPIRVPNMHLTFLRRGVSDRCRIISSLLSGRGS